MRRSSRVLELVTVLLSAVIGGLALVTPASVAWLRGGTATVQIELLATNMPRAAAIGCLAAVVVAVFGSTAESLVVPWASALCSMIVLLLNHMLGRSLSSIAPLTTLNYIDSLAGGVLLGGLAAAAAIKLAMTLAFILGALTAVVIGELNTPGGLGEVHGVARWLIVDSPPLWLICPATVLFAWCTLRYRLGRRYSALTVELPLRPIMAAVIGISVPVLGSEWLVRNGVENSDLALVTAATVLAALIAGRLLPGRDGMLLQLAVGVGTVGSVIVPLPLPMWFIPFSITLDLAGLLYGLRRPSPVAAMLALLGLSLFGVLITGPLHNTLTIALIGTVVLGFVTGYAFSAALPGNSPSIMLGIAMLLVPGVVISMRGRLFYTDPSLVLNEVKPALVAVVIAVGCLLNLLLLRRRPVEEPEPATPPAAV